jgi:hypothetical protein
MGYAFAKGMFVAGFLTTWVGLVLLTVPMVIRFLGGPWLKALGSSRTERYEVASHFMAREFQTFGKTFAGRWGQRVLATGISIMMLAGILWLTLKIVARYS